MYIRSGGYTFNLILCALLHFIFLIAKISGSAINDRSTDTHSLESLEVNFYPKHGIFGPFALITVSNFPGYHNIPLSGARMSLQTYLATADLGKPIVVPKPNEIRYSYLLNTTTPNGYLPDKLDPADPHLGAYGTLEYPVQGFHTHITAMLKYDARKDREVLYFSQVDGNNVEQSWWEFDEKHRLGFMGRFDGWWVCTDIVIPDGMKRGIVWMDGKRGRKDKCTKVEIRKSEWDR